MICNAPQPVGDPSMLPAAAARFTLCVRAAK